MTSQKFQLTKQYKRKQKNVWIFLALFFPFFFITTHFYATNEKFSWQSLWIEIITTLVFTTIIVCTVYFRGLKKIWKYSIELEFRKNEFIIYEMNKQKHFVYSKIKEVIFCTDINKKLLYVKLMLPKKNQYIYGFEKEEEIIKILKNKIKEYNIKRTEKVKYINKMNYYYLIVVILISLILWLLISHYFIYK